MIISQKILIPGNTFQHSDSSASIHVQLEGSSEVVVLNANDYAFKNDKDIDDFVKELKIFMKEKEDRQNATFKKIMVGISV